MGSKVCVTEDVPAWPPEAGRWEAFATSSLHARGFTQVECSGAWMGRWEAQLSVT